METDEFDVNKKIKIEVSWEDELLCDKKVEVKSEPLELENQDTSNHEMMEVKDEFGKTMEDFDLSHVKSTSETVDCFDFKSLGCDKSSAHEIVCSNDFQNFAQRKSSIMPLFPEIEDYSYHCNQCPYSATSESNLTNHKEFVHKNVCDLKSNKSENPVGKDWKPDAHQPSKVIEPSRPKEPSNVGYQLKEDITVQGLNPTIDQSTFNEESKNNPTLNQSSNAFSQKNMLVSHQKKKHLNPKLHACQECQIVFLTKAKLDIHLDIVHQKSEHFSCQFCDRSFLLRIQLKNHQMKEHSSQKKELISNLKSVHEKPILFKCQYCEKSFESEFMLKRHLNRLNQCNLKRSLNNQKFFCMECECGFATKEKLQIHMKSVHLKPKPILFKCKHCEKIFKGRFHLKRHKKKVHF